MIDDGLFMVYDLDDMPYGLMNYAEYLASDIWRDKRISWINEAQGICQECGNRNRLTIHHPDYDYLGQEDFLDIKVLCWPCHLREHNRTISYGNT